MKKDSEDIQTDSPSKRETLRKLILAGGVVATADMIPDKWSKPVIESFILPAHAQASPVDSEGGVEGGVFDLSGGGGGGGGLVGGGGGGGGLVGGGDPSAG